MAERLQFKSHHLVLLALATVIFPRLVTALGAPSILNFIHFACVPAVFALVCLSIPYRNLRLLLALLVFLVAITLSTLAGEAGVINGSLEFLLLAEPFLFLLIITSVRWSHASVVGFRYWLMLFALINASYTYYQYLVLGLSGDDVKGVFLDMGAGHHLAGAVALTAAVYFFVDPPIRSPWFRLPIALFFVPPVIFSDAKQVIAVFLISAILLSVWKLLTLQDVGMSVVYLGASLFGAVVVFLMSQTIFPALAAWVDVALITTGLSEKFSVFSLIASYYTSFTNVLVGLGPGHTIGRLGQMLPNYLAYLEPLGATTSPVTEAVYRVQQNHWITNSQTGSSLWSPMFSWAGVWGDLGLLGLAAYLYLWLLVGSRYCPDDLSKFYLINILVFGVVFDWMEEPGYVLFVVTLIGLRWQVHQSKEGVTDHGPHARGLPPGMNSSATMVRRRRFEPG